MDLVTRGRLSVQRVSEAAWTAVQSLANAGGWDDLDLTPKKKGAAKNTPAERGAGSHPRAAKTKAKAKARRKKNSDSEGEDDDDYDDDEEIISKTTSSRRKRKAEDYEELPPPQRASRAKVTA